MTRKTASKRTKKNEVTEMPLLVLTNEMTPFKSQMLQMIYNAASYGQLAFMDGMHPETGEIHSLLVGLPPAGETGQLMVFPLAKIITKSDEIVEYLIPDGKGGYFDGRNESIESGEAQARPPE